MREQIGMDFEKEVPVKAIRSRRAGRAEMLSQCICPRTGKTFWLKGMAIYFEWEKTQSREMCGCCGNGKNI